MRVPLPVSGNLSENHSHNLGKALAKGWVYSARLSTLYPFHLSLSLSLLSLPPSLYLSFYLSSSLSPSLCLLSIILFGVSNVSLFLNNAFLLSKIVIIDLFLRCIYYYCIEEAIKKRFGADFALLMSLIVHK